MKGIACQDDEDYSCFLAVFLSHGDTDKVKMKEGQLHIEDDILALFRGNKCKAFLRKPKIFIFQVSKSNKPMYFINIPKARASAETLLGGA